MPSRGSRGIDSRSLISVALFHLAGFDLEAAARESLLSLFLSFATSPPRSFSELGNGNSEVDCAIT